MSGGNELIELLEQIARSDKIAQAHDILQRAVRDYGLANIAYGAINLPTSRHERPLVAVTYAPEWQKHYLQSGYVNIDPVVRAGLGGVLPIDWSMIDRKDPVVMRFFGEARRI